MAGKEIKGNSKRANYRHGKWVRTPTPHADISKYMFNKKEEPVKRRREELSTMKMPKKRRPRAGPQAGRPKSS